MPISGKWKSVIVAVVALTPLVAGMPAQAGHVPAPHECSDDHLCFWSQTNFRGDRVEVHPGSTGDCEELEFHARYVMNNTGHAFKLYEDHDCENLVTRPRRGRLAADTEVATITPGAGSYLHS